MEGTGQCCSSLRPFGQRWFAETPDFKADASSVIGTMIGGRLDWIKFAAAAERLLPKLLAEPIPYVHMHSQRLTR
jgi:hypothetical protein